MRFDFLQSISLAGNAATANDDRVGVSDSLAWVIDGATDLGEPGLVGTRGGAAWIAMEANTAFAAAGDASIELICRGVLARIARRFDAVRTRAPFADWELPSGAFLAARVNDHSIECAWLADCAGLLLRGDRVERFGAQPSKDEEGDMAAGLAEYGLGGAKRVQPIIDALRESRMQPSRFVLGVDPGVVDRLGKAVIPCAPGDEVLLMSDGFSALFDVYAAVDPDAAMRTLAHTGLDGLATRLRAIEADDADCVRYPRFKKSDDATAIWLRIVT